MPNASSPPSRMVKPMRKPIEASPISLHADGQGLLSQMVD